MENLIMGGNMWVDTLNLRLGLESAKLPTLSKESEDFSPGGSFFQLAMPGEIKGLEAEISLRGSPPAMRSLFGREPGDWTTFFWYERIRNAVRGENVGRVVRLKGLVSEVEQGEVKGKKGEVDKYKIATIVRYDDRVDGKVVHLFDFFKNRLVINGVDYTAEHNRLIAA